MELIDFDAKIQKLLGFKDWAEYNQFFTHLSVHATLAFILISINWKLGFISLGFGIYKELINDGHWKNLFKNRDGKLDLLSRTLGSCLPYITLIWK